MRNLHAVSCRSATRLAEREPCYPALRTGALHLTVLLLLGASTHAAEPARIQRITNDGYFKQRPSFSPDGRSVVFARHKGATIFLFVRDLKTGKERRLTKREFPEYDAVFSPNGKELVFALDKASPNQGDIEVYRIGIEGKPLTAVAVTEGKLSHEESPCWSPGAKMIAFTSTRHGNQELYVAQADGKNPRRLTSDPAIDAHPAWSPDGHTIAFATNRWGDLELALIDVDGSNLRRLTNSKGLDDYPAWSPDGKRLAFTSNRDRNLEIYLVDRDGRNALNLTQNPAIDNFPGWTHDGKIGFVSNRDDGFEIYVKSDPRVNAGRQVNGAN